MAQVISDHGRWAETPDDRHSALGLKPDELVAMYRALVLARVLDQKAWNLNRTGKARFVIPGQGQEASQVGSAWALRRGHDVVLPHYRDVGVVLTLGMTPYEVLLNVLARPEDPNSGGRQMPYHWGSRRLGIITQSSPIGTQIPHAAGLAKAAQIRGDDQVTACYFGEATSSKGDFHEALNFAGIHRLPVVFVCENNLYAISVPHRLQSAVPDVADRAKAYGFEGVVVDGNDVLEVFAATLEAVERARGGGGPTMVECKTYRLLPHTSDDDDRAYRSAEEVEAWRRRDPIPRMRDYLLGHTILSVEEEAALQEEVKDEVNEASRRAEEAVEATPEMAFTCVFKQPARPVRGVPARVNDVPSPAPSPKAESGEELSILETVRTTLDELMAADERVVVLGEDVGILGGVFRATQGLQASYGPDRVIDMPLAESAIAGVGIGLALAGLKPVVEIQFADFLHSSFDQIVSEAARIHYRSAGDFHVPMVIRAPWGGGTHRAIYHSQAVEAFYAHVPGLKVVAPSTPADVAGLLRTAVHDPDPVIFLEHKKTYRRVRGLVPGNDWRIPIGLADVVRPGDDMTLVTYGLHRHHAVEAAERLAEEEGASIELIDLRTIAPLDRDTLLASVVKTGRLLVVHEDNVSFGVGAEISALVTEEAFYDLDAPVRRLAMPDVPAMPYAIPMEKAVMIGVQDIKDAAMALMLE